MLKFLGLCSGNKPAGKQLTADSKFEGSNPVPEAGLLTKGSCLARASGVTKFIEIRDMILVTLCCAT
jgi:hypothetical protein